jgi:hypothetical protein
VASCEVFVKMVSGRPTLLVVRWNFLVDSSAVPVEVFFKFGFVTPYVVVGFVRCLHAVCLERRGELLGLSSCVFLYICG